MTTTQEMACQELVQVVTEYLEETLPELDRRRLEEHLRACAGCRAYIEQMRRIVELNGRLTEESISETERAELVRLFRGWRAELS